MIDWLDTLDLKLQALVISSITSVSIFALGWIFRILYERFSLNYKLKKEFEFEQKINLKKDIAKNKVPLLNSVEDFNHRLWNFNNNIEKNWHKASNKNKNDANQYYINSFVYRFLVFMYWTLKTEKDTISIDSTIADKNDILFLKYVKTFKDIFSNADMLSVLHYSTDKNTNHFFKNDLAGYSKLVVKNNQLIDFDEFTSSLDLKNDRLQKVFTYFSEIENKKSDKNLNVLRCFHLVSINFLNKFGHNYQKIEKKKLCKIVETYKEKIMIKNEFNKFISKSKLTNEMYIIFKKLNI